MQYGLYTIAIPLFLAVGGGGLSTQVALVWGYWECVPPERERMKDHVIALTIKYFEMCYRQQYYSASYKLKVDNSPIFLGLSARKQ